MMPFAWLARASARFTWLARASARFDWRLLLCLALCACAALARREKVKLAEERQHRARELDAQHVAAEPFRRFEQAVRSAEALPAEAPERDDYLSEARLWLETAISEAETAALARERLMIERETVTIDEAYLADERARLAIEDERERALAADIARQEAQRALARAAEIPSLRVKLNADETRRAAQALLARAELIALSVNPSRDGPARDALLAQIAAARALLAKSADEALKRADRALLAGLALVGRTRDANATPSAAQKASLAEALSLLGATLTRAEHGLSAALTDKGKEQSLTRLCGLARDYPAGDIQVTFGAHDKQGGDTALLAKHGCQGPRFLNAARAAGAPLSFTFLAY